MPVKVVRRPRVAANIVLSNCGNFIGSNVSGDMSDGNYWSDNGSSFSSMMQWNTWSITLSPVSSVLDSASGIMSVDNSDTSAAKGSVFNSVPVIQHRQIHTLLISVLL